MSRRVLVVDDEKLIVKGIRFSLEQDGYDVDCAYDGEEALKLAKENAYDIILLDVMLPKYDGFEVCQQIREYSDVPIIMLTAKGDDMDKILGLDYGADDYITKPFNILEVKARIKAIMRRVSKRDKNQENEKVIVKGEMKIDCESRRVIIGEKEINLTAKEFDLLELLAFINDEDIRCATGAERAVSRALGGSCQVPLAAHGIVENGELWLRAHVGDHRDGRKICAQARGKAADFEAVAAKVVADLKAQGAEALLAEVLAATAK